MPKKRNAPVDGKRYPIYESVDKACKTGCFFCGGLLDPTQAVRTGRPLGSGTHYVKCQCGDVKEFDVQGGPR
ncbi:MAG: hypothetical protein PHX83_07055 [Acidobacteriia bacterium]|nr:hypothetical protein [Terriglobia bacterium]